MPTSAYAGKEWIRELLNHIDAENKIESVIDIGVGEGTYSNLFRPHFGTRWIGIEAYEPYVEAYGLASKYDQIIVADARNMDVPDSKSYSVGFLGDVLEHMTIEEAGVLYEKMITLCDYVFISIPIVHFPQGDVEGNPYERHVVDDWSHDKVLKKFPHIHTWYRGNVVGCYLASKYNKIEVASANPPRVAVYSITKNEEKYVDKMIESAWDADKIVVVDTGSTDNTWKKLQWWHKHYPNKVIIDQCHVRPWRFDIARNYSMAKVPANIDLCICLDLDEVMLPGWRHALNDVWLTPFHHRLRYLYVWSWDEKGQPLTTYWADKVHARWGFRWHHPVHEVMQYYGAGAERQVFCNGFTIHHYPDSAKSRGQYLPLLEQAIREDESDDRNAYYLGREYFYRGQWEQCVTQLERHLALPKAIWRPERGSSMRFLSKAYVKIGNRDAAFKNLLRAVEECPDMREPWVDLAQYYFDEGNWELAYIAVKRALTLGQTPHLYLTDHSYFKAYPYDLLASAAWRIGLKDQAIEASDKALEHFPTDPRLLGNHAVYTSSP